MKKNEKGTEKKKNNQKFSECLKKSKKGVIICIVIAIVIVVLAIVLSIIAVNMKSTNNSNSSETSIETKESIVGDYKLVEIYTEGNNNSDDVNALDAVGLTVKLEINEDNTAKLSMFGETVEYTYNEKEFINDDSIVSYTFENKRITLEEDDTKMVFEKIEENN